MVVVVEEEEVVVVGAAVTAEGEATLARTAKGAVMPLLHLEMVVVGAEAVPVAGREVMEEQAVLLDQTDKREKTVIKKCESGVTKNKALYMM
ncbi:hypothetical protein DPMN_067611 [Dreissena polymorpha]|uniref:Uncharacterized protein n=2 Tax=Dreissena polymorpha TaxID=45954 RepID=A0A9D3YZY6_DREPO|nr:hypothetical protein DPMN_067611 [Dreissena polymorpha]